MLYFSTWRQWLYGRTSPVSFQKTWPSISLLNREKVAEWLEKEDLPTVLARDWGFSIRSVEPALDFDFLVGWTKEVAVSSHMVKQIKNNMNTSFLQASKETVDSLVKALHEGQEEKIMELLEQASQLLENLSSDIYTPSLRQLKMPVMT